MRDMVGPFPSTGGSPTRTARPTPKGRNRVARGLHMPGPNPQRIIIRHALQRRLRQPLLSPPSE